MLKIVLQLKKLLIKKSLLVFLLSINLYANNTSILNGNWVFKEYSVDRQSEPYHLLNITLDIRDNNQINGKFEYFFRWFSRIEEPKNFTSTLSNDIFEFAFDSNFGGKNGKVRIKINDDCSLDWVLLKEPEGEYYAPFKAHLLPDKLEVNQYCKKQDILLKVRKYIQVQKQPLYSKPNIKTKMYLIKGDRVEVLEEKDDWLYILYHGKKDIKAWIPKNSVE
ncbi:hypothetical protein [Halarcobacter anaerophilus]|jgi:hypothetical protein|uniref:Uncharacterized protein n=1 Tax=Halarcobacter anaerophilus TaxID=877500 RepID=A0A4Q0XYR8_9BACT|nr:hypothetical protein [Halarcobacter anaerophilus]QDF28501.1 hypothetical protein AANAER_1014 [Halarcobacter anaerophilus]RXJ61091.1 hypothetical protein CRV06_14725 [Halarcobacter anaerophilus]